jgi:hypothetical protein
MPDEKDFTVSAYLNKTKIFVIAVYFLPSF